MWNYCWYISSFVVLTSFNFKWTFAIIGPPVKCHGPVPKISEGKYYFHDNDTYLLRFSTSVEMSLDMHQRSCFQVDITESAQTTGNQTSKLSSLFYSVGYSSYQQSYDVRQSYTFGIAELQSFCRCDCPGGEPFCTHDFGRKHCSKGEICITRFHSYQPSFGCNTDQKKHSTLCCEISVRPYKDRRFVGMSLVEPRPQTHLQIEIYAKYDDKWTLFRRYNRKILPFKGNTLRLNGFENVADMYIRASSESPQYYLKNGDKWYFYEEKPKFQLIDDTRINSLYKRDPNQFGWLRFEDGRWSIGDRLILHDLQRPRVTNCKQQKYSDSYLISSSNVMVIRNSSGEINAEPYLGANVVEKQRFVDSVTLSKSSFGDRRDVSLTVNFKATAAPTLNLDIRLHQKMAIIPHMYASYLEDFVAEICLDKHSNRYLNITLIKSYGQFSIEVFRDPGRQEMDLVLSMITDLPFATNYTEILPLPGFVSSSRLVCIFSANKPENRLCKWATFRSEPMDWFQLKTTFIKNVGSCPGCNRETSTGGFLSYLNPKSWFDGINSLSEGIGLIVQIAVYVIILVILIALWRKCLWPLASWAVCSPGREYAIKPEVV